MTHIFNALNTLFNLSNMFIEDFFLQFLVKVQFRGLELYKETEGII